jgi:hypothetical protein
VSLPIITADQRLREKQGVKLVLLGKSGIGKTTQLKTLPEASTLFVDLEAGDLAVKDWRGDCVRPSTWPEFRDLVVFLAGPNPALPPEAPFSDAHYRHVCERYGDPGQLAKYDCYFVDSITVLARMCLTLCKSQPQAFSERTGKPDTRGAYGLLGSELIGALTHLQHARGKHVVFVAILDERLDDFNRKVFVPQIEGAKTAAELPGIVDEVVTLAEIKAEDGSAYRAFVTHTVNPFGYRGKLIPGVFLYGATARVHAIAGDTPSGLPAFPATVGVNADDELVRLAGGSTSVLPDPAADIGVNAHVDLIRRNSPSSELWSRDGGYDWRLRTFPSARKDIHFSGHGVIAGTVKEKGQPDQPLVRRVQLISENARVLVAETWSDASGNYRFELLDPAQRYTVVSYDYKQMYRAVIADNLRPEMMP